MNLQYFSDKFAIGLSAMCLIHCLALPVLLVFFPTTLLMALSHEMFHQTMLFGVLPISAIALTVGYMHHKALSVLLISLPGLVLLVAPALLEHEVLGELGEVILTVAGSTFIAIGHFRNSRMSKLLNAAEANS